MAIRYLLDEHLSPTYRSQLVRRNPELVVRIIGDLDVPPQGYSRSRDFDLVPNQWIYFGDEQP
ncbi:hypothetical protein [Nostoc sp.]|uniref:hypothetical protein n=1 Tax=Nostoc sp. TaxID=1180 RepID=UPI002FF46EBF